MYTSSWNTIIIIVIKGDVLTLGLRSMRGCLLLINGCLHFRGMNMYPYVYMYMELKLQEVS